MSNTSVYEPIKRPSAARAQLPDNDLPTMHARVLFLGEQNCGKTCLIKASLYNLLQRQGLKHESEQYMFSSAYDGTVGVDYFTTPYVTTREVDIDSMLATTRNTPLHTNLQQLLPKLALVKDGRSGSRLCRVRVLPHLIDMSGDLAYVKVRSELYGDWQVAVLCVDLSDRSSFEKLPVWLQELSQFGGASKPATKVYVLGLKSDAPNKAVSPSELQSWSAKHVAGSIVHIVSARKNEGIGEWFSSMVDQMVGDIRPSTHRINVQQQAHAQQSSTDADKDKEGVKSSSDNANSGTEAPVESMAVAALIAELRTRGVPQVEWGVEKQDMMRKLKEVRSQQTTSSPSSSSSSSLSSSASASGGGRHYTRPSSSYNNNTQTQTHAKDEDGTDRLLGAVRVEVDAWSADKDIFKMLNQINGVDKNDPIYISSVSTSDSVGKAYKRAMLKVHPDKQNPQDKKGLIRATEMFKVITNVYEEFKKQPQVASNATSTANASASSTAKAQKNFYSTHTPFYGNEKRKK